MNKSVYKTVCLNDLIYKLKLSNDDIQRILAEFSCPLNKDVEYFLKLKAIEFEKVNLARTYLVYAINNNDSKLCGVYSLASGHLVLDSKISRAQKKKFFGTTYSFERHINTHLIGQLSKNYHNNYNQLISGTSLIELAFHRIKEKINAAQVQLFILTVKMNLNLENFMKV